MNILILSVYGIQDSNSGYLYADLVREFSRHNHKVYAVTPTTNEQVSFVDSNGVTIIHVKNGQIQKTGKIKKVINLLSLETKAIRAIKKCAKNVKFDLIVNMCSNLCYKKTSAYFKKRDRSTVFVLMKDIFPQNAVDIEMMPPTGIMGMIYSYFRKKEKRLYAVSDYIGCMSQANKNYIIAHNAEIESDSVTIVPNSIEPKNVSLTNEERRSMRKKYGLPLDKTVFVYGGNLGKPQDVPFIIECLKTQAYNKDAFFLIVGDGTEYGKFETFMEKEAQPNIKVLRILPREDFDTMLAACDVGMIFLDHRFSIPNYPSRLLSYMQAGLPVLACTDPNTDVGKDIVNNGFGWWCESNNVEVFDKTIQEALSSDLQEMSLNSLNFLREHFTVEKAYKKIMTTLCGDKL